MTWFSCFMQLLYRDIVLPCHDSVFCFSVVTMSRQRFPCRDRDGHNKRSGVAISLALGRDFMSRQSVFMSRQSLVKTKSFYVATELAKVKRIYVSTKNSMSRQSCLKLCRDKVYLTLQQKVPRHEVFHVAT